jgi:hypothetical protein
MADSQIFSVVRDGLGLAKVEFVTTIALSALQPLTASAKIFSPIRSML